MSTNTNSDTALTDLPDSITIEVSTAEALDPIDSDTIDAEEREQLVALEAVLQTDARLAELALEHMDEDALPEAESLLWLDEAEVYPLCPVHYHEKQDAAWTGGTSHPNHAELKQEMYERLRDGTPCADCKTERRRELETEIRERVTINVEVEDAE
jgi:hypothetical protein